MKPHQCSICHKTFKRPRDADMHLRDTHNGEGQIVPTGKRRYHIPSDWMKYGHNGVESTQAGEDDVDG